MAETEISSSSSDDSSIDDDNHPISKAYKKAKMADTSTTTISRDFISGLPDAILCDILSYVPTQQEVETSVLSKRWNQVWTSVPNLDFSSEHRSDDAPPVNETHFMNFVDRVLSLNNVSRVRNIYLHCNNNCDSLRTNAWINAIITRDCEKFDLEIPRACLIEKLDQSSRFYSLPDSFYARNNLVKLLLKCIALKVPMSVNFPSLKTIDFDSVQLLDDVSMKKLLSGCPYLLFLDIKRREWHNAQTLYICSTTLIYLSLSTHYCERDFGYKVVSDAPNLFGLSLTDWVDADYDIVNLSSLVSVVVSVQHEEYLRVQTGWELFNFRLFELFRKISHVEDLCFATGTMHSFIEALLDDLPIFNNLTRMNVELVVYHGWSNLPYLFHCAPNLVTFILEKDDIHPDCDWCEPNEVPQCFLSTLETVEIRNFEECDDEIGMIYYFLLNAMVLKKLSIVSCNLELEKEVNILKKLAMLPRSSSICQIQYRNFRW